MTPYMQKRINDMNECFIKHEATFYPSTKENPAAVLIWKKPGTIFYQVTYTFIENNLFISGDCGLWTLDLTYPITNEDILSGLTNLDVPYYASKLACTNKKRRIFDADLFKENICDRLWCSTDLSDKLIGEIYEEIHYDPYDWQYEQIATFNAYQRMENLVEDWDRSGDDDKIEAARGELNDPELWHWLSQCGYTTYPVILVLLDQLKCAAKQITERK